MHVHSCHSSDSKSGVRDIFKALKKNGFAGAAITDHNAIKGTLEAIGIARELGMTAIRGIEITSKDGHILAYGICETVEDGLTVAETIEEIRALGGIAVASHPYRKISGVGGKIAASCDFGGIETLNSRSPRKENVKAQKIAEDRGLSQTGGSDAHELENIGNAYALFPAGLASEDEFMDALRKKETKVGGRSILLGETVKYYYDISTNWAKRGFKRA